jgi:DNA-binding MarR family transcriptional regulator
MADADVLQVLRHFPRIYYACHGRHVRRRSTAAGLTAQDSMILGHFEPGARVTPSALAAHLGLAPSSVSPTLRRLLARHLLIQTSRAGDRRMHELRITPAGEQAMADASVLDPERVNLVLSELSPAKRRRAFEGLSLLARAARSADVAWRTRHARSE